MKYRLAAICLLTLSTLTAFTADSPLPANFKAKLQTTVTRHLNQLLKEDGSITEMKGKTSEGNGALAFYLMFEITGESKFRQAAHNA